MKGRWTHNKFMRNVVRPMLEEIWREQIAKLGEADREECRCLARDRIVNGEGVGPKQVVEIFENAVDRGESNVLQANQQKLRKAIDRARDAIDPQLRLPGMVRNKLYEELCPIRNMFVRRPGDDRKYGSITNVASLDFEILRQMAEVRDDNINSCLLSKEAYDFMDRARVALNAKNTQTLGWVFGLDSQTS